MDKYKLVPVELIDRFPEINPSNYGHDDACTLSAWGVELVLAAVDAPTVQKEPVGWQFYQDGKWWNGDDQIKDHRKNTEAAGLPVRDVYAAQGEPVVWMYSYIGGTEVLTSEERWTGKAWKSYWEETPLYAAPQPAVQGEPVGWRSRFLKLMGEMQSELDDSNDDPIPSELWSLWRELLDSAPQPAEQQPEPTDEQIIAITTAYEQGVGKGHQAANKGVEIENVYDEGWGCRLAWQLGYEEGKERAREADAAQTTPEVARDVEMFGVSFVVDGARVSPDRVVVQYATRHEQADPQPAPDVAVLVEALELISDTDPDEETAWFHETADNALAAYRKQGGGK